MFCNKIDFLIMTYSNKAYQIVKNSISSAIFIDEKAKEFYSSAPANTQIVEEKLSVDLHKGFKEEGISLSVHKFLKTDIADSNIIKYLFKDRDLVLLDWELDDVTGEEYSLKLLSEVINSPHINFCCIYTRTSRFDSIPSQLNTYFSGLNATDYALIEKAFDFIDITELEAFLNRNGNDIIEFLAENQIDLNSFPNKEQFDCEDIQLLKYIYYSLKKNIKPENRELSADVITTNSDSFIINNTFIFVLKKDSVNDPNASSLLKRISDSLITTKNSFIQLLGLEMQTLFNSNENFIDENLLNSSTNALFSHRNHLKGLYKNDVTFNNLIKKILIEHANLKLRTSKLSLLDTSFLDTETSKYAKTPEPNEVFSLNTFYNSVTVRGLNQTDVPSLNFGDIFKDSDDIYYVCITALCDCYIPNKIDHNYYFATGNEIDLSLALKLGDTAFISFLPTGKCICWGNIEFLKKEKIKKGLFTDEQFAYKQLEVEKEALENFIYKPFYIKPKVFNVKGSKIVDNKISARELKYRQNKVDYQEDLIFTDFEYITTLRPDYAQRIANHSFGHPARVGVDFVKI